ncbi:MAG: hypothetical protein RLZZ502_338 [Pseudomonadota bacterium]|jgi:flavin reductase (DIM6/NTAB) family NADH-FMN oxidoreductase RutF
MSVSLKPENFTPDSLYFLLRDSIVPRPVAWVSTIDAHGNSNLAPFSFFTVVSANPPVLGFSCGPRNEDRHTATVDYKDTLSNVLATGQCVINVCPEKWLDEMVRSSDPLPSGESEFAHTGLSPAASTTVACPRVAGVPVAYECVLNQTIGFGNNTFCIVKVQHIHIDEGVYLGDVRGEPHRIDLFAVNDTRPVGRLGRAHYAKMRDLVTVLRKDGG